MCVDDQREDQLWRIRVHPVTTALHVCCSRENGNGLSQHTTALRRVLNIDIHVKYKARKGQRTPLAVTRSRPCSRHCSLADYHTPIRPGLELRCRCRVAASVAAGAPSQQLQLLASDALMTQLVSWLHSPSDQLREEAFAALDNLGPAARQLFGLEPAELGPEGDGVCAEAPGWATSAAAAPYPCREATQRWLGDWTLRSYPRGGCVRHASSIHLTFWRKRALPHAYRHARSHTPVEVSESAPTDRTTR